MKPVTRNEDGSVTRLSFLRERRLLQMAWHRKCDHKRFYSQFCHLMWRGLVRWDLGAASLTQQGHSRMKMLVEKERRHEFR